MHAIKAQGHKICAWKLCMCFSLLSSSKQNVHWRLKNWCDLLTSCELTAKLGILIASFQTRAVLLQSLVLYRLLFHHVKCTISNLTVKLLSGLGSVLLLDCVLHKFSFCHSNCVLFSSVLPFNIIFVFFMYSCFYFCINWNVLICNWNSSQLLSFMKEISQRLWSFI